VLLFARAGVVPVPPVTAFRLPVEAILIAEDEG